MNAHISENQPDKELQTVIDLMNLFTNPNDEEAKNNLKKIQESGIDAEGLMGLFGEEFFEAMGQRPIQDVAIQLLTDTATIPTYANVTDACADLYADEDVWIQPGETHLISTGIALAIPDGHVCHIYPRSGISVKTPLRLANSVGVIDAGYRDEIKVAMWNSGTEAIHITQGMRIAQMDIYVAPAIEFIEVDDVKEIGEDRGGGFGSTNLF